MTFANFIKSVLEQTGLTNYKLAKLIGVSQTTVANWANGATEPHDKKRAEVLALFGVSENDLKSENIVIKYEQKKPSVPEDEGLDLLDTEALNLFRQLWPDNRKHLLEIAQSLLKAQEAVGGHSWKDS